MVEELEKKFVEGYIMAMLDAVNLTHDLEYNVFLNENGLDRVELKIVPDGELDDNQLLINKLFDIKQFIDKSNYGLFYEVGLYIDFSNKMLIIK